MTLLSSWKSRLKGKKGLKGMIHGKQGQQSYSFFKQHLVTGRKPSTRA